MHKNNKRETFSLQSGAFGRSKNAEDQKNDLISSGFNARIIELNRNGLILYAVRVGYYDTKNGAQKIGVGVAIVIGINAMIAREALRKASIMISPIPRLATRKQIHWSRNRLLIRFVKRT